MANIYINPDHVNDGDGDGTADKTGAGGAYNDWASVSWAPGNSYLQKRGTTSEVWINVDANATLGNEIYVGAYYNDDGTDDTSQPKPIIDGLGTLAQCVRASGKEFINYRDLVAKNSTGTGIVIWGHATRNPSFCTIKRCEAYDCLGGGIIISELPNFTSYETITEAVIEDSKAIDCGGHGIAIVGELDDCTIRGSYALKCGFAANAWGIYVSPRSSKVNANIWVAAPNSSWETDITNSALGALEVLVELIFEGRTDASATNIVFTEGTFDSLNNDEWAQSGSTIQLKAAQEPNNKSVIFNVTHAVNCLISDSHAEYTKNDSGGDGNGIGYDHYVQNSAVRNCRSNNNTGKGFSDHIGEDNIYTVNVMIDNAVAGIAMFSSIRNQTYNNEISGNAYGVYHGNGATSTLKYNIITNNGEDIAEAASAANDVITDDYNCIYNNTVENATGANNVTSDPLQDSNYKLAASSPCLGIGVKWWGTAPRPVGLDGEPFPDWDIDIGVNQSMFSPHHPSNI